MRKSSLSVLISAAASVMATYPITLDHYHQASFHAVVPKPAGLPSQNPTHSFWIDDANPLAREGSTGPLTTDADVCIIGAGITGVSVAYHLSEASQSPLKVVVFEARDFCAGATGRNGGHLTPAAFNGFQDRATKYGQEEARRSYAIEAYTASSLVRLVHEHGWTDDVDLVHGGHIDLFLSDEETEASRRDRQAAVDVGWPLDDVLELSEDEVEATFGVRHPAVKIPGYNLWPLKLVAKLYQLAKSHASPGSFDLSLHTHTPVTAVERTNASLSHASARAYTLSTSRGAIACSRVVHATNGYASHLLPLLAGQQGIVPVRGQVLATRASVGTDEIKTSGWSGGAAYWFPRPTKKVGENPLIVIGGIRNAAGPASEAFVDDDSTYHPKIGEALRAFLPALFEGMYEPGREPEMEWTGIMGYTAMGDPFVGPVDRLPVVRRSVQDAARYVGQYIAAGYSGHGMPRAFACAEVVVQMIVAELASTVWAQPEWLPTRYLTWEERGPTIRN